jgi:hypothetical protein
MNNFDFSRTSIRSWLNQGLVSLGDQSEQSAQQSKKPSSSRLAGNGGSGLKVAAGALLIGMSVFAFANAETAISPGLSAYSIPINQDAIARRALMESVKTIESLGDDWDGNYHHAAKSQAVTAAEKIIQALPRMDADASAGLNEEGNIFFKFQLGAKYAYLTIEPSMMHLLMIVPGKPNVYVDNVKFNPGQVPNKIKTALERELVN